MYKLLIASSAVVGSALRLGAVSAEGDVLTPGDEPPATMEEVDIAAEAPVPAAPDAPAEETTEAEPAEEAAEDAPPAGCMAKFSSCVSRGITWVSENPDQAQSIFSRAMACFANCKCCKGKAADAADEDFEMVATEDAAEAPAPAEPTGAEEAPAPAAPTETTLSSFFDEI